MFTNIFSHIFSTLSLCLLKKCIYAVSPLPWPKDATSSFLFFISCPLLQLSPCATNPLILCYIFSWLLPAPSFALRVWLYLGSPCWQRTHVHCATSWRQSLPLTCPGLAWSQWTSVTLATLTSRNYIVMRSPYFSWRVGMCASIGLIAKCWRECWQKLRRSGRKTEFRFKWKTDILIERVFWE